MSFSLMSKGERYMVIKQKEAKGEVLGEGEVLVIKQKQKKQQERIATKKETKHMRSESYGEKHLKESLKHIYDVLASFF